MDPQGALVRQDVAGAKRLQGLCCFVERGVPADDGHRAELQRPAQLNACSAHRAVGRVQDYAVTRLQAASNSKLQTFHNRAGGIMVVGFHFYESGRAEEETLRVPKSSRRR